MAIVPLPDFSEWLDDPGNFEREEAGWGREGNHANIANVVLAEMGLVDATSVIEVGCGTGRLAEALLERSSGLDYIGIDKNARCVKAARERLGDRAHRIIQADVRNAKIDYKPGRMVVSIAVLKHFGLHEWSEVVTWMCGWGDHVFLNYQEREEPLDDGVEFPHVWVTGKMMKDALVAGGIEPSQSIFLRSNDIGIDYIATGTRLGK